MPSSKNQPSDLLEDTVKDGLKAPMSTIGEFVSDMLYLKFGDRALESKKRRIEHQILLEQHAKAIREKYEDISPEKRIEPDYQIAGQALEASLYCLKNEIIREMFQNLIVSTANSDTADLAHPSFPEKIKQMSSLDAQLLCIFRDSSVEPICQYRSIVDEKDSYNILATNVFLSGDCDLMTDTINRRSASIDLLSNLGLISVSYEELLITEERYERFNDTPMYASFSIEEKNKGNRVELKKGIARLSPLGKRLLTICFPD